MRVVALLIGAAAMAAANEEDYLSAKLAPPWVDTTDSPVIDLKPPPQPPNPPPPPKDGAIWGTFYPAAPPPPPPPPPPLPFPLAAAAGGGKSAGTDSTGATGTPKSFLQVLEAGVREGRLGRQDSSLAQMHASLLAVTAASAPGGPLASAAVSQAADGDAARSVLSTTTGSEVASAASEEARAAAVRAVKAGLAERATSAVPPLVPGRVSLASLLQSSASARSGTLAAARQAEHRRAAEALTAMGASHAASAVLSQALGLPRFASASLSAYASRRRAAADLLRTAARAAERSAAEALRGADLPGPDSDAAAGMADSPVDLHARAAGLVASGALRAAGDRQRFRQRARALAGSTQSAVAQFGPHFGINYDGGAYSYPYNPYVFTSTPHSYGPSGLGTHPMGGPLYANFGYFPPSSAILDGIVTPQGDPDPKKLGKAQSASLKGKADVDNNGNAKGKDKPAPPPTGAYNPSAPPFFLRGTGWPYPYFMSPNVAPPAVHNPISAAHFAPRYNDVPVLHGW